LTGDFSGSLFLTDNDQDVIKKNCSNNCDKLKQELQENLGELKLVRLINELLQTELNSTYVAKHVRMNKVNNMNGENCDGRESGTDKNTWIQIITGQRKPQEDKIILM